MATRNLTEVFMLMRNNCIHSRQSYSDRVIDEDRMALVSGISNDLEAGVKLKSTLPPEWVDVVEEIHYDISKIKNKMEELSGLHDKHVNRPTLNDTIDEEHAIEIRTQEITQMFYRCQRTIQSIGSRSRTASDIEKNLANNVMSSLASKVQELSLNFRRGQSFYLKKLRHREERSKQFFDSDVFSCEDQRMMDDNMDDMDEDAGFSQHQLKYMEDTTVMVEQRDNEVKQIVQSIADLNQIFADLANMIVDQGTVLDRIDYNIEKTSSQINSGLTQLQKAEKHQKSNRKMLIIMILAIIVSIMIIILIATKF